MAGGGEGASKGGASAAVSKTVRELEMMAGMNVTAKKKENVASRQENVEERAS